MRPFIFSLTLFLLTCSVSFAQTPPPEKYAAAVDELRKWIEQEVAAKGIPGLSLALVDDQDVIWSEGFGKTDDAKSSATGPRTVFRIGSVSKPITALLLMLYVEQGKIDLDAPVTDYVPDFQPNNTSGKKITLRQALSHRTGLVRESPVGGYFDDTAPSLAAAVKSLNGTDLVYEPESMTSYSNAAPCLSGVALERIEKKPFAEIIKEKLFTPLGMTDTAAELTPALKPKLAKAIMWTYHGRQFPAPVFELATSPAGNIYSTPLDQAKLLSFLFARGKSQGKEVLKPETIESMWKIQYGKPGDKAGFGLGWFVSEFEGKRRIGHGGAVYGFATEFAALPDDKLGVIVCAARDVANGTTRRIADVALRHMLAVRAGKPLPTIDKTEAVPAELVKSLPGVYLKDGVLLEITADAGKLFIWPPRVGMRFELKKRGNELIIDDLQGYGAVIALEDDTILWNKQPYKRRPAAVPAPAPEKWAPFIGEFGPEHNRLTILEKDGVLHALIEWVFLYPLTQTGETTFKFPDYGLYHGHPLVFLRDKSGKVTAVEAANYRFARLPLPRPGETFKLTPVRPIDELRKAALAAAPPVEKNSLLKTPDLVDVTKLDPTIKLDIRYAGDNNFLGTPVYTSARAFLQRPAAEAVVRVHKSLAKDGVGLLIHDAYRPWHVTKIFYDAVEPRHHLFVADPAQGSRHNRGCAVDLTLYDLKSGQPLTMPSSYDEFSDRSYPGYLGGTSLQRHHRDLLRQAMEAERFTVFPAEWWHFDFADWRSYPILNEQFEKLK